MDVRLGRSLGIPAGRVSAQYSEALLVRAGRMSGHWLWVCLVSSGGFGCGSIVFILF